MVMLVGVIVGAVGAVVGVEQEVELMSGGKLVLAWSWHLGSLNFTLVSSHFHPTTAHVGCRRSYGEMFKFKFN